VAVEAAVVAVNLRVALQNLPIPEQAAQAVVEVAHRQMHRMLV
jgi:hypothetical protein